MLDISKSVNDTERCDNRVMKTHMRIRSKTRKGTYEEMYKKITKNQTRHNLSSGGTKEKF